MGRRGVHFALREDEASRLLEQANGDEELMAAVEEIERRWDRDWIEETDKAWDAIHRCLTDGTLHNGDTSFHKCILGTENLFEGDGYTVNALDPLEVKDVFEAIKDIGKDWLRRKYKAIDANDYGMPLSEEDFEYTWASFEGLKRFFEKAATHNRSVVFTVDY